MNLVAIETPYAADENHTAGENKRFARCCMLDSLRRGEAPFLSHLLYTQVLLDSRPEERDLGMTAGITLSLRLDYAVFYLDMGISPGMSAAMKRYTSEKFPTQQRFLWSK